MYSTISNSPNLFINGQPVGPEGMHEPLPSDGLSIKSGESTYSVCINRGRILLQPVFYENGAPCYYGGSSVLAPNTSYPLGRFGMISVDENNFVVITPVTPPPEPSPPPPPPRPADVGPGRYDFELANGEYRELFVRGKKLVLMSQARAVIAGYGDPASNSMVWTTLVSRRPVGLDGERIWVSFDGQSGVTVHISDTPAPMPVYERTPVRDIRGNPIVSENYVQVRNANSLHDGDILPGRDFDMSDPDTFYRELLTINFGADSKAHEVLVKARQIGEAGRAAGKTNLEIATEVADMVQGDFSPRQSPREGNGDGEARTVGAFFEDGGCCRHRSALVQMALQEARIPSHYVRGNIWFLGGGRHAWVEVDVRGDGSYSYVIDLNMSTRGYKENVKMSDGQLTYQVKNYFQYFVDPGRVNEVWRFKSDVPAEGASRFYPVEDQCAVPRGGRGETGKRFGGFIAGLFTMIGLNQLASWVGIDRIPVVRQIMSGVIFYAGHIAGTYTAAPEAGLRAAATSPQSLMAFFESGGRFMALMPVITGVMDRIGLTRERIGDFFYSAGAISSTMAADYGLMRGATALVSLLERRGATAAAGIVGKMATRAIPYLGWALLARDAYLEIPDLIAMLPGVDEDNLNARLELAKGFWDSNARQLLSPFIFMDGRPEGLDDAVNLIASADDTAEGRAKLDEIMVEMNLDVFDKGRQLRSAFMGMLVQSVAMQIVEGLENDTVNTEGAVSRETVLEILGERFMDILNYSDPSTIEGTPLDDDLDNGESGIDWLAVEKIDNYEKIEQLLLDGYDLSTVREMAPDEETFNKGLDRFMNKILTNMGSMSMPFGGDVFNDDIQTAIRSREASRLSELALREDLGGVRSNDIFDHIESYRIIHRMIALLMHAGHAGGQLVIDERPFPGEAGPVISEQDKNDGLVVTIDEWDSLYQAGFRYRIFESSPYFQIVESIVMQAIEIQQESGQ